MIQIAFILEVVVSLPGVARFRYNTNSRVRLFEGLPERVQDSSSLQYEDTHAQVLEIRLPVFQYNEPLNDSSVELKKCSGESAGPCAPG